MAKKKIVEVYVGSGISTAPWENQIACCTPEYENMPIDAVKEVKKFIDANLDKGTDQLPIAVVSTSSDVAMFVHSYAGKMGYTAHFFYRGKTTTGVGRRISVNEMFTIFNKVFRYIDKESGTDD